MSAANASPTRGVELGLMVLALLIGSAAGIEGGEPRRARRLAPTAPAEVLVDPSFSMATPGWGVDRFATVQSGVDGVGLGGLVRVAAGRYVENITIEKKIRLLGAGMGATVLDGAGRGDTIRVSSCAGGRISDLSVERSSEGRAGLHLNGVAGWYVARVASVRNDGHGFVLQGSDGVTIADCITADNFSGGIFFQRSSNSMVRRCVLDDAATVALYGSPFNTVSENSIRAHHGWGVALVASSHSNTVRRNTIVGTPDDLPCTLIRSIQSSGNLIEDNELRVGGVGIYLSYGVGHVVARNVIETITMGDAVMLYHVDRSHVLNNRLDNPDYAGVVLFGESSDNTIAGNFLTGGWMGIGAFHGSSGNRISGNDVDNPRFGVVVDGSPGNVVVGNNVSATVACADSEAGTAWQEQGRGNYWACYQGADSDGDGVGDSPYEIDSGSADPFPLVDPIVVTEVPLPRPEPVPSSILEEIGVEVIGDEVWENEDRTVVGIHVNAGASLVLRNVTLRVESHGDGGFLVDSGGRLEILDSTVFANGQNFCFRPGSIFRLIDSELHNAGNWGGGAFMIETDAIEIRRSRLRDIWGPSSLNPTRGHVIEGNIFEQMYQGLVLSMSDGVVVDNVFIDSVRGAVGLLGEANEVRDNVVRNVWYRPVTVHGGSEGRENVVSRNAFFDYKEVADGGGAVSFDRDGVGNYWSDYLGQNPHAREVSAGVWDTPYRMTAGGRWDHPLFDHCPLTCPPARETIRPPEAVAPVAPADGGIVAGDEVIFQWSASPSADEYRLVVARDEAFTDAVFNRAGITLTSTRVRVAEPDGDLYWRVIPLRTGCHGPWSTAARFTLRRSPAEAHRPTP